MKALTSMTFAKGMKQTPAMKEASELNWITFSLLGMRTNLSHPYVGKRLSKKTVKTITQTINEALAEVEGIRQSSKEKENGETN